MTSTRTTTYAAWMAAAAIVVAFGILGKADVPHVATGTWVGAPDVGDIALGAAAVALPDGRLLVTGGSRTGADGQTQRLAEIAIYDATRGSWMRAGQMTMARSGHTATLLADGRVVLAGGAAADGVT